MKTLITNLCALVLVCLSYRVLAQEVTGTINDERGEFLYGATISENGTNNGVVARIDGTFALKVLKIPTQLKISFVGYADQTIDVTKEGSIGTVTLVEDAIFGEEVVVSASRKPEKITESSASVSVLSSARITAQPIEGDALNMIKNIQGVRLINNGVAKINVSLRGQALVNETQTLVLKDYRSLHNTHTTIIDNERMGVNPLDIAKIEVIRGPSGALWGPGVNAGVVHFLTKDPFKHPGTSISVSRSLEGQNINKLNFRHAASGKKFGYKILYMHRSGDDFVYDPSNPEDVASAATTINADGPPITAVPTARDGIIQAPDGGGDILLPVMRDANGNIITRGAGAVIAGVDVSNEPIYNLIPDFHTNSIEASFEFKPTNDLKIAIAPQYGESEINFRNAASHTRDWGNILNIQGRVNYRDFFASLNYFHAYGWDGKNGSTANGNRSAALIATSIDSRGDIEVYDFASQLPFSAGEKWGFVTGVDVKLLRFDGKTVQSLPSRHGRYEDDDNFDVIGGYFQASFKPIEKVKINAVARVDNFSIYGSSFSPRLGLVFNPDKEKNHALRFSLSRAYRAPSPILTNFDVRLAGRNLSGVRDSQTFNNAFINYAILGADLSALDTSSDRPSLQSFLEVIDANNGTSFADTYTVAGNATPTITDPLTRANFDAVSDQFIEKAKLEYTDGVELGYSGITNDKAFKYTVDFFYQIQTNMLDNINSVGPEVQFNSIADDLTAALTAANASDQDIADAVAAAEVLFGSSGSGTVFGTWSDQVEEGIQSGSQDARGLSNTGIRTYQGSAKYLGAEVDLQYNGAPFGLIPFATFSWLSDVVFDTEELDDDPTSGRVYYLNTPPFRARFGVSKLALEEQGLYGSLTGRYDAGFEARDGVWSGDVESYFMIDAAVGFKFSDKFKAGINATNLTDVLYRPMPNIPAQRRLVFVNLTYSVGDNILK